MSLSGQLIMRMLFKNRLLMRQSKRTPRAHARQKLVIRLVDKSTQGLARVGE